MAALRPHRELNFVAIGTPWHIALFDEVDDGAFVEISQGVDRLSEDFDRHYSRFRADSLVTRIALKAGDYNLPPDARPMLDLYADLYELTKGRFTPLIGQTLSDAGYDADYSLAPKALRHPPAWPEVMHYQWPRLRTSQPVLLDFGAAGKGYLVDLVSAFLERQGVGHYLVDASGDMTARVTEPLAIGLEHPDDSGLVIGVVRLGNMSLCGSAGNRRAWGDFTHILDPLTLTSPRHIKAIWVTSSSALLADALATCLSLVPAAELLERYQFEYAVMLEDNSVERSDGFPAEIFTT